MDRVEARDRQPAERVVRLAPLWHRDKHGGAMLSRGGGASRAREQH
jgi:hypothetical protein